MAPFETDNYILDEQTALHLVQFHVKPSSFFWQGIAMPRHYIISRQTSGDLEKQGKAISLFLERANTLLENRT